MNTLVVQVYIPLSSCKQTIIIYPTKVYMLPISALRFYSDHRNIVRFVWSLVFYLLEESMLIIWWTISPREYHPPSSQYFGTDMMY